MAELRLSDPVFAILSGLIEDRSGLSYTYADKDLLSEKVSARAAEAGFDSLLDYYYFLRYDESSGAELDALIDTLVVGETYLFREAEPLALVAEMTTRLAAEGQRPRIWSAACATGEEPITLALLLAQSGTLKKVDIVASDISVRALDRAKRGAFGRRALRGPCPPQATQWLESREDGPPIVKREVIEAIDFRRVNLVDDKAVAALGCFDIILCRNVLIYFRDEVVRRVVDALTSALKPAGTLFVGVSESLLRFGTSLSCEERRGVFFYRKPERTK